MQVRWPCITDYAENYVIIFSLGPVEMSNSWCAEPNLLVWHVRRARSSPVVFNSKSWIGFQTSNCLVPNLMHNWNEEMIFAQFNCLDHICTWKIQVTSMGFEPTTSVMPMQCLNANWAMKPHSWEKVTVCWVHVFLWKKWRMKAILLWLWNVV